MTRRKKTGFILPLAVIIILFITGLSVNASKINATQPPYENSNEAGAKLEKIDPPVNIELLDETDKEKEKQPATSTEAVKNPANNGIFVPPEKGYWIDVSIDEQKVRIYLDGSQIKEWTASTGTPEKPTPLGVFNIQNRGKWFFNSKYKQGAKWWVSFKDWGIYLFHTVPMDQEQNIIPEEAAKLGSPASHGCIRLEVENAKWIYDNIPQGTPVYIHR